MVSSVCVAGCCEYSIGQFNNFNFEAMQCLKNWSKVVMDPVNCGCVEVCCHISHVGVGAEVVG